MTDTPATTDPTTNAAYDQLVSQSKDIFGGNYNKVAQQLTADEASREMALQQDPDLYITQLYEEYLGSAPGQQGLDWWKQRLQDTFHGDLGALAKGFASAPAAQQRTPNRMWDPSNPFSGIGQAQLGQMNPGDWSQVLSVAEQWSSTVGWKEFPSATALYNLYQSGAYLDYKTAAAWLTKQSADPGLAAKAPWAGTGMSKSQYDATIQQYSDTFETYTGNRNIDPGLISTMINEQWSPQRMTAFLLRDPNLTSQYGWLKYGYTYQGWQDYKHSNKTQVVARFGSQAAEGDAAYLTGLAQPLTSFSGGGAASKTSQQETQRQQTGMSEVR